jgi:sugar-specific transcriptional regulator TrmB
MYNQILQNLGLNLDQSQIYLSLLEEGPQTASQLANNTSVKRTYVYNVVKSLANLGLASQEQKGKTTFFKAASPDHLLNIAKDQAAKAQQAHSALDNILPFLSSSFILSGSRPIITYHEGIEGIKYIYKDTLLEGKPIQAFLQNAEINPELRNWLRNTYVPQRVEKGIHAQVIISSGELSKEYILNSQNNLRTTIEVPSESFPFKHEVNIYGTKVAFMDFQSPQVLGFIINHPNIASTMKAWFELTWNSLQASKSTVIST